LGPGLGSALAGRFAAGGFDLLLLNRSTPPMQAVAAELSRVVDTGRHPAG